MAIPRWCGHPQLCRMATAVAVCWLVAFGMSVASLFAGTSVDAAAIHATLMSVAFLGLLPMVSMVFYGPRSADRRLLGMLYKRLLVLFMAFALAGVASVVVYKLNRGHHLWPQSVHAWLGTTVLGLMMLQFVLPCFTKNAWTVMDQGAEMPFGALTLYVSGLAIWSGTWGLLGDDTRLVALVPVVLGAVAVVRGCTEVKPPDYVVTEFNDLRPV